MKTFFRLFLFIVATTIASAQVPTITSFSPHSGAIGTTVTIQGTNFNSTLTNNIVYFGGVRATVTSATSASLSVSVPGGASYGPVSVSVGGLTAVSTMRFTPTFSGTQSIDNSSFAPRADFSAQNVPLEIIRLADLNGDGKLDLINSYNILRNTTTTALSFAAPVQHNLNVAYGTVFSVDLDGDGTLDLCNNNESGGFIHYTRNTSTGDAMTLASPKSISSAVRSMGVKDVDSDGKPDLVFCYGRTVGVYRNTSVVGTISFASPTTLYTWNVTFPVASLCSDVNNDGADELVVYCGDSTLAVFQNTSTPGNFSLQPPTTLSLKTPGYKMAVLDADNDGKTDLLLTQSATVSIFRNTTAGSSISFSAPVITQFGSTVIQDFDIGDLNGDGKPDFVFVNQNDVRVLMNTSTVGTVAFTPTFNAELTVQLWPFGVAVGDLDSDGRPDIATANKYGMSVSIFRNIIAPPPQRVMTISSVAPLSGPVGSSVTITGSNFDPSPANNVVTFGAARATVLTASATTLTVSVPIGATYDPVAVSSGGMTAHSAATFDVTFSSQNQIHTGAFFRNLDIPTTKKPTDMVINDFDNNGKSDIAVIGRTDTIIQIFRNTCDYGTPPFTKHLELPATRSGKGATDFMLSFSGGDINGDGKLDLIAVCYDSIIVYANTSTPGSISFGTKVSFPGVGIQWGDAALGDLDADGKLDLAIIKPDATLAILRNLGSGSTILFGAPSPVATSSAHDIRIIDLDADGRPEIIVRGGETNVQVLRNTSSPGAISFASPLILATDQNATSLDVADINNDGKQDIVVSCWGSFSVFLNSSTAGTLSLAPKQTITPGLGLEAQSLAFSDIDGDGKVDLVATWYSIQGYGSYFKVLKNTSSGSTISFQPVVNFMTPDRCWAFFIADMDNDSKPDVLIPNPAKNTFSLYWNTVWPPQISKPTIQSITPNTGTMGTRITITGTGFDPTPTKNNVYFGNARAEVLTASSSTLYMRVPAGAMSGPVTVTQHGLTTKSSTPFQILLPGSHGLDTTSFKMAANLTVTYNNVSYPYTTEAIKVADFNCDGKMEVLSSLTTSQSHQILTWINTSTKDSIKYSLSGSGGMAGTLTVNDFDGDGRLDLASSGMYVSPNISLGQESVFGYVFFLTGNAPKGVASGDFDNDGKPDIAAVDNTANILSVFRNTSIPGTISMEKKIDYPTGAGPFFIAVGDITGDGKLDIAVTNRGTNLISLYRNTSSPGTISFASKVDLATGLNPYGIEVADIDGDGNLDIVTSNAEQMISIHRTLGSGSTFNFAPRVNFSTGSTGGPLGISLGDLDGDGTLDIGVAMNIYGRKAFSLFRNVSTPSDVKFEKRLDFTTSNTMLAYEVALADVNADGKMDVLCGGYGYNSITVYQNTIPVVVGVEDPAALPPKEFILQQNYPNPFNPSTIIQYHLPTTSRISIRIFNLLGQEVVTLINEEQSAGRYSIQWNALAPSGIYFCRMSARPSSGQGSEYSSTSKMMLIH